MPTRVGTQTIKAGCRFLGIVSTVGMLLGPIRRLGWNYPLYKHYCAPWVKFATVKNGTMYRGTTHVACINPAVIYERCVRQHRSPIIDRNIFITSRASPLSILLSLLWPHYQAVWNIYIKIKLTLLVDLLFHLQGIFNPCFSSWCRILSADFFFVLPSASFF